MRLTRPICGVAAALAVVLAPPLRAEVIHVRDYNLHEPRDRGVLFTMAVTPDQDVLSLVVKGDGKWRLTRVRSWLEKTPEEQTIAVPGWNRADLVGVLGLFPELFVTPDGNLAIVIAGAIWSRSAAQGGGKSSIVSVVDLREFKVVTSLHQATPPSGVWSYYLDRGGQLVLEAGTNGTELLLLTLPDLTVKDRCTYSVTGGAGRSPAVVGRNGKLLTPAPVRRAGDCAALVERESGGNVSFQKFLDGLEDSYGCPPDHRPPQPCRLSFTRDGRFQAESREKQHLTTWNRHCVTDELGENVVSVKTGKQVGTINETTRDTIDSRFATQDGRDYVVVIEGGTRLRTYEVKE